MIGFNYIKFQEQLLTEIQIIFNEYKNENICGFAISTDEDARSVNVSINTRDYLRQCWKKDIDEDKEYYKWYPAEWKYEAINNVKINELSLVLFNLQRTSNPENDKKALYELLVDTLKKLKENIFFNSMQNDFVLVFNITDNEDLDSDLNWIKELNNEDLFNEYKKWTESW